MVDLTNINQPFPWLSSVLSKESRAFGFAPRDVLKPTWHQDPQEEALGKGYVS